MSDFISGIEASLESTPEKPDGETAQATPFNDDTVAEYLLNNPAFFERQPWLLDKLSMSHEVKGAVSLIEHRTKRLQNNHDKLKTDLNSLVDHATYNEHQFEKTKRLVLELLQCSTLDQITDALEESLCRDFKSDDVALVVFSQNDIVSNHVNVVDPRQMGPITPLVASSLPTCGEFSDAQLEFIFGEQDAALIQSAAIAPLIFGHNIGLLAIGSHQSSYFHSGQGTELLSYVAEVLSRVIVRVLRELEINTGL